MHTFEYLLLSFILIFISSAQADTVANTNSNAKAATGEYISWKEHRIDDSELGKIDLSGSDGLAMADLDLDGYEDIVSVHEADTVYDGKLVGQVRIAWGSADPMRWQLTTLAFGEEVAAAEDVTIADANGDGYPDIVVAAELEHLIYFANPGKNAQTTEWERTIPPIASERGSYIRAFFADFNRDGHPEIVAANKGGQSPGRDTVIRNNISIYHLPTDPINGNLWTEQVLTKVRIPINSMPVDLDGDGDMDVVAGSRGERRILWFENMGDFNFKEHVINTEGKPEVINLQGFNMDFADIDADGRTDIISNAEGNSLFWFKAPSNYEDAWKAHLIGQTGPDSLVSVRLHDIDSDGDLDAFTGGYSRGPRDQDGDAITAEDRLGRIAWFENPGINDNATPWKRHDISRRKRGMYDKWMARDLDNDGDIDFIGTRGNSAPYDGVIWLEQIRSDKPQPNFIGAREIDSEQMPLSTQ